MAESNTTPVTAHEDTIAAIATAPGVGAIAIIRVSGSRAIASLENIFRGKHSLTNVASHTIHFGQIVGDAGTPIDEVLVSVFRAPHSYTGEDSVEVSCHGGVIVTQKILEEILRHEIRHALPGEFTRRAFLNGRIDLAQAEAVADLIHSQSQDAQEASLAQLEGALSNVVRAIREELLHATSLLELNLDFAEEDIDLTPRDALHERIIAMRALLAGMLSTYSSGKIIRDGLRIAIVGKPNAGKSSLLNALIGTNRAIVTDIPGTTRDFIEESLMKNGQLLRLIDTAGLRATSDLIEQKGMDFSMEQMQAADIICNVIDLSAPEIFPMVIQRELDWFVQHNVEANRIVFVFNKMDLLSAKSDTIDALRRNTSVPQFFIAALHNAGIDELAQWFAEYARALSRRTIEGDVLVTNARHADCLRKAGDFLDKAEQALGSGLTEEYVAYELRQATDALGEIIGAVTSDDVLNNIFSRFCIGK